MAEAVRTGLRYATDGGVNEVYDHHDGPREVAAGSTKAVEDASHESVILRVAAGFISASDQQPNRGVYHREMFERLWP